MDEISNTALPARAKVKRRRHSSEFRARVVAACDQTGVSIAAVARQYGLNANLVHKWRRALRTDNHQSPEPDGFVALPLPIPAMDTDTRVTLMIGELTIRWPLNHIHQSIAWLKALQS